MCLHSATTLVRFGPLGDGIHWKVMGYVMWRISPLLRSANHMTITDDLFISCARHVSSSFTCGYELIAMCIVHSLTHHNDMQVLDTKTYHEGGSKLSHFLVAMCATSHGLLICGRRA